MDLDFKKPCTYTMSANEIRTASECARKRYYSSRDCLAIRANKPAKALMLGSAVHSYFQYYYTELDKKVKELGIVNPDYDLLADLIEQIPPVEIYDWDKLDADSQAVCRNIFELYRPQIIIDLVEFEVLSCETAFQMDNWPIEDVMYHGNIDMVVRNRGDHKVYFFEHKTCKDFRPDIYNRFDIQLHIYHTYGTKTYGDEFGGMILNQVKKAKTEKGYGAQRDLISYSIDELNDFYDWLMRKTEAICNPDNHHAPCNNYMTCKMCEYAPICLKYGYEVPKTTEEIINAFEEEVTTLDENNKIQVVKQPMYKYDPRETEEEG